MMDAREAQAIARRLNLMLFGLGPPLQPVAALAYWIHINGGPPQDFEEAPFLN